MMLSLADWLWAAQRGVCLLQITDACRARNGRMTERTTSNAKSRATLEHVWPKSKRRKGGEATLVVLACAGCNNKKGSDPPTLEYLYAARRLWERWQDYRKECGGEPPTDVRRSRATDPLAKVRATVAEARARYRAATFDPKELQRLDDEARREIAKACGVTDPDYLPGARREKRAEEARAKRDALRAAGIMVMAPTRRER